MSLTLCSYFCLQDDFKATWRGGTLSYDAFRFVVEMNLNDPASADFNANHNFTGQNFVTGRSILTRFESSDDKGVTSVSFLEYTFSMNKIKTMRYSEAASASARGQIVHQFNDVFDSNDYDVWTSLVSDDWVGHSSGKLYTLDSWVDFIRMGESRRASTPMKSRRKIFSLTNPNVMYSLWSRSTYNGMVIHTFESSSNLIKSSYFYRTTDISTMANVVEVFEKMLNFTMPLDGGENGNVLDQYDNLAMSDDFMIDSYFGGWQTRSEFRESVISSRSSMKPTGMTSKLNAGRIFQGNVIANTGYYTRGVSDLQNVNYTKFFRQPIVSTAEMYYFDPQQPSVLQTVYVYNSTSVM